MTHTHARSIVKKMDEDQAIRQAIQYASAWRTRMTFIDGDSVAATTTTRENKKSHHVMPSAYVCRRCKFQGHHISKCPTNGDRAYDKPRERQGCAGIPRTFLKAVTTKEEEIYALTMNDGSFHVAPPRLDVFEREMKRHCNNARIRCPEHLLCLMCKKLIKDAVKFPCCTTTSFCHDCLFFGEQDGSDRISCPICKRFVSSPFLLSFFPSSYLYIESLR